MKHIQTILRPQFVLEFTTAEVELMFRASVHHYDLSCSGWSNPHGGKIIGWMNAVKLTGTVEVNLTWGELDLLRNICEQAGDQTLLVFLDDLLMDTPSFVEMAERT